MNITCFISHSWLDGGHDFALKLADALESHGVGKVWIDAWIDERKMLGGGHLGDQMTRGVQACDVFLFFMSPAAVASEDCKHELEEALRQRSETGMQIIPLLVRDLEEGSIPEELKGLLYIDFRDKERFNEALEKLLTSIEEAYSIRAAVLGVLDSDSETRFVAAQRLAVLKNRFSVPILARRLDPKIEPDPTVRHWLAYALGRIGGDEACAALRMAEARETDLFARRGIAEGLRAAGCQVQ